MIPLPFAGAALATLLGILGCSMTVSVGAIPRLPRFRIARQRLQILAGASLGAALLLMLWVLGS